MNYAPKNNKLIKRFKNIKFAACRRKKLNFGFMGIQARGFGVLNTKQIEAGRRFMVRNLLKRTALYRRIYLTYPKYKKSSGHMMGRGSKKNFHYWAGNVRSGQILFENNYLTPFFFKYKKKQLKKKYSLQQPRLFKIKHKFSFKLALLKRSIRINKKFMSNFFLTHKFFIFFKRTKKIYRRIRPKSLNKVRTAQFVKKYLLFSACERGRSKDSSLYLEKLNNAAFKAKFEIKLFQKNKKQFASKRYRKKLQKRFLRLGKIYSLKTSVLFKNFLYLTKPGVRVTLPIKKLPVKIFFYNKTGKKKFINLFQLLNRKEFNYKIL